jgi:hypothetical protein
VPGRDFAGVVVKGGGDEWNGKEVWGSGAGLGVKKDGSHAQYVAIPLDWLSAKPANLSMGEASAVRVSYLVSWKALVDAADIQSGETVLITGVAACRRQKRLSRKRRLWLNAKGVWIDDATRQQQRVEIVGLSLCEIHVDGELLVPIRKIPAADPIRLQRYDPCFSAGLVERLARFGELDFLQAVGHQDGDL